MNFGCVRLDDEVRLYGREALEHGLHVWGTTDRLIFFGLPGAAIGMPVAGHATERGFLFGDAASRQPHYAKLARASARARPRPHSGLVSRAWRPERRSWSVRPPR